MSTYNKLTKHPNTGKWENATWHDDHFGKHKYGVQFPSQPDVYYSADDVDLETKEEPQAGIQNRVKKTKVTYEVSHYIKEASASREGSACAQGRRIQALVEIDTITGATTIIGVRPNGQHQQGGNYTFIESDPHVVNAIGQILCIAAAKVEEIMKGEIDIEEGNVEQKP